MSNLIFSWLIPLFFTVSIMERITRFMPTLHHWYLFMPLSALIIYLMRDLLCDIYGKQLVIRSTVVNMTKEEWDSMQSHNGDEDGL